MALVMSIVPIYFFITHVCGHGFVSKKWFPEFFDENDLQEFGVHIPPHATTARYPNKTYTPQDEDYNKYERYKNILSKAGNQKKLAPWKVKKASKSHPIVDIRSAKDFSPKHQVKSESHFGYDPYWPEVTTKAPTGFEHIKKVQALRGFYQFSPDTSFRRKGHVISPASHFESKKTKLKKLLEKYVINSRKPVWNISFNGPSIPNYSYKPQTLETRGNSMKIKNGPSSNSENTHPDKANLNDYFFHQTKINGFPNGFIRRPIKSLSINLPDQAVKYFKRYFLRSAAKPDYSKYQKYLRLTSLGRLSHSDPLKYTVSLPIPNYVGHHDIRSYPEKNDTPSEYSKYLLYVLIRKSINNPLRYRDGNSLASSTLKNELEHSLHSSTHFQKGVISRRAEVQPLLNKMNTIRYNPGYPQSNIQDVVNLQKFGVGLAEELLNMVQGVESSTEIPTYKYEDINGAPFPTQKSKYQNHNSSTIEERLETESSTFSRQNRRMGYGTNAFDEDPAEFQFMPSDGNYNDNNGPQNKPGDDRKDINHPIGREGVERKVEEGMYDDFVTYTRPAVSWHYVGNRGRTTTPNPEPNPVNVDEALHQSLRYLRMKAQENKAGLMQGSDLLNVALKNLQILDEIEAGNLTTPALDMGVLLTDLDKLGSLRQIAIITTLGRRIGDRSMMPTLKSTTLPILDKKSILRTLPDLDDFGAPIKWVKFNSKDTAQGYARVTDPKTGKNEQHNVLGELYVPVIDEDLGRLNITAVTPRTSSQDPRNHTAVATQSHALKTVMSAMNISKTDERDWLVFEVVLGIKLAPIQCDEEGCPSRCFHMNCDTYCNGDTCSSGCVGRSCNAFCKGDGCLTMCIGEFCSAKCDGNSCEARCWGKDCTSSCHRFSCSFMTNGIGNQSVTSWDQNYPDQMLRVPSGDVQGDPIFGATASPQFYKDYYGNEE